MVFQEYKKKMNAFRKLDFFFLFAGKKVGSRLVGPVRYNGFQSLGQSLKAERFQR